MKRTYKTNVIIMAICLILLVIIAIFSNNHQLEENYYPELDGAKYLITAEEINVRETPKGKIVGKLKKGDQVTLSGVTYELPVKYQRSDDGTLYDYWVELDNGYYIINWALTGGRIW